MTDERKALIIEDDTATRKVIAAYLQSLGFICLEAEDVISGLQIVADDPGIVLALVDLNLEPFSGYAFLRALGREEKYRHIKSIMVTGEAVKVAVQTAVQDGARGYILKPLAKPQLLACLKEIGFTDLDSAEEAVSADEDGAVAAAGEQTSEPDAVDETSVEQNADQDSEEPKPDT